MTTQVANQACRTRIAVDVSPQLRREVRVAAARRDESMTRWVIEAVENRLAEEGAVRDKK